jgi:competence protein ComEA
MTLRKVILTLVVFCASLGFSQVYAQDQLALNINSASIEQFEKMKGIGARKAQAIVEYRLQNGNFATVEDLVKVKGIGTKFISKNRAWLSVQ